MIELFGEIIFERMGKEFILKRQLCGNYGMYGVEEWPVSEGDVCLILDQHPEIVKKAGWMRRPTPNQIIAGVSAHLNIILSEEEAAELWQAIAEEGR